MRARVIAATIMLAVVWTRSLALGVPNLPQVPGTLLAGPNAPEAGRTAVIAWHGDMLLTFPEAPGSPPGDYQVRAWDISNPSAPVVTQQIGTTRHGFMAHGYIKTGTTLHSGYNLQVSESGMVTTAPDINFRMLGWEHGGMSVPWGVTTYWTYGDTSQAAQIFLDQPWGATPLAQFNPVGDTGVIGHPFVFGRYLFYASEQSRTGIAAYDISNPATPVLLDVLKQGNIGGYWPEPFGINGRLYFFFPRSEPGGGFSVVDATDPTDLKLVADVPLDGNPNYVQFQDEFAFAERYKIDMRSFEVVLALDENASTRAGPPVDTSQFALPIGNLLVTGGLYTAGTCTVPGFSSSHCGTGMSIWAHQAAPDTRGPFVGFHAPADGETGYPATHPIQVLIHENLKSETINASSVRLRPLVQGEPGADVPAEYWFSSNDILSIVPHQPLAADTTYRVELVAGGIQDAVGNGMQPYAFEFSTGGTLAGNAAPVVSELIVDANPVAPGVPVGITTTASDPEGQALQYRYDFGDGSPGSAWLADPNVTHQFTQAGHYRITVQVRDSDLRISSRSRGVTVHPPVVDTGARNDSQIAWRTGAEGGELWVVNPDNDSVTVLREDGSKRAEYRVCGDPRSISFDADDRAWVTCFDADAIAILAADGRRVATLDTGYGSQPFAVVTDSSGERALVSLYGAGAVAWFDTRAFTELSRVPLGPTPRAIALAGNAGRAFITRFISGDEGQVWEVAINGAQLSLERTIALGLQWGLDDTTDGRGLPNYLAGIAITPDGERAWVSAKKDNITRGLYLSGEDLDQDNTVRAMLAQIDLNTGEELIDLRRDLDNTEGPTAIRFSPLGDYAWVALQGSNDVLLLDSLKIDAGFSGPASVVSRIGVGAAPQALWYSASGARLWVHNFLDRSLSAVDLGAFINQGNANFITSNHPLVDTERLDPAVLRGKRIFYHAADPRMSGEGYMGCASCHVDGGHDGQTYDFSGRGEGLRNTASLQGRGGTGHGLLHWSANFDEVQDFENDMRLAFGGQGFLSEAQFDDTRDPLGAPKAGLSPALDDLAAYVASLDVNSLPRSPYRSADGHMSAAAMRGADLFMALGCVGCHADPAGTISTGFTADLRNVGSLGTRSGQRRGAVLNGIDIPSLHGSFATAPYLHHGEAASLEAVFSHRGQQVTQAEDASLTGGTQVRDRNHWSLADLAVVRAGRFVRFDNGGRAGFEVSRAQAGPTELTLRYHANYGGVNLRLSVNGVDSNLAVPVTLGNDWRYARWREHRLPVSLASGANSIVIEKLSGGDFALDEIAVPGEDGLPAHRQVAGLGAGEQADLMSYVLSLDGRPHTPAQLALAAPLPDMRLGGIFQLHAAAQTAGPAEVTYTLNAGTPNVAPLSGGGFHASIDTRGLDTGWHTLTVSVVDTATGTRSEQQRQFFRDPDSDRDQDGLTDDHEADWLTDPELADTDGDGSSDGAEVTAGSDPLNAASRPSAAPAARQVPLPPALLFALALVLVSCALTRLHRIYATPGADRQAVAARFRRRSSSGRSRRT